MNVVSSGLSNWKSVKEITSDARIGSSLKSSIPSSQGAISRMPSVLSYRKRDLRIIFFKAFLSISAGDFSGMIYYACSLMKTFNKPVFNDLFFTRAYYFCFMGGWGFVLPFINLFYISIGFSGKQIGVISSVSAVIGMIVSPLW